MMKKSNIKEKDLEQEYLLLEDTAQFIVSMINRKAAELESFKNKLESQWDEVTSKKLESCLDELKGLNNKMEWEKRQANKFSERMSLFQEQKKSEFINNLSKKLAAFQKKSN